MKALFFLILLANAAVFMWEYKTGALENYNYEVELPQDLEPIRLVSESVPAQPQPSTEPMPIVDASGQGGQLDKPEAKATDQVSSSPEQLAQVENEVPARALQEKNQPVENPAASAKTEERPENKCYEAGPFATETDYQTWLKQLPVTNPDLKQIYKEGHVISSYLVYYPAGDTDEQAQDNIKRLKEKGITDLWLIRKGEDAGLISLALFKGESRAQVMKDELKRQKDIDAQVKPKYVAGKVRYVQIKVNINDSDLLINRATEQYALTQIDCR